MTRLVALGLVSLTLATPLLPSATAIEEWFLGCGTTTVGVKCQVCYGPSGPSPYPGYCRNGSPGYHWGPFCDLWIAGRCVQAWDPSA